MKRNELFKKMFLHKKNELLKGNKPLIIDAKVTKIHNKYIEAIGIKNNQSYVCYYNDITDFNDVDLNQIFKINWTYQFIVKKKSQGNCLTYKSLHPEQIKFKFKPVSTISHYRNLYIFLCNEINKI